MAISGTFLADFASFSSAAADATVRLKTFEDSGSKVASALDKVANSLSGTKLIQDATLAAEAVNRIGGVSQLTAAELARVGAVAQDAAAKLAAMGQDVPPKIQDLADRARGAAEELLRLESSSATAGTASEGLGARITGVVAAAAAAREALSSLVSIGSEWIKAAGEQESASVRLDTALRAQGKDAPGVVAQYAALATQYGQTSAYSAALVTESEALLTTIGKVMPQDMARALQATTDLAAGLRIDLPSATTLVAKALEGNTTALHRHGIEIDAVALQTQGATAVFDAIAKTMGGQGAAQAATFGGEMGRLGNVITLVKEDLGGFIAEGLKPLIDGFLSLPTPVRSGIVTFGLLGTAVAAVATAIAGIGAAVALAAPLLGFTAAGTGAVALGFLGTAATALAAAFWPVTAAIAAIWAGWKVGNIEGIKNTIAEWTLRLGGMSAANAHAAVTATALAVAAAGVATEFGTQATAVEGFTAKQQTAINKLVAGMQGEAISTKELSAAITQTITTGDLDVAGKERVIAEIEKLKRAHQDLSPVMQQFLDDNKELTPEYAKAEAALKSFNIATANLAVVGKTWQDTLAGQNQSLMDDVQAMLKAGATASDLAIAWGIAPPIIKANQDAIVAHTAKLKLLETEQLEVTKLWAEYDDVVASDSGSAYQKAGAAIDKWYADTVAANQKAKTDTAEFYAAVSALDDAKWAHLSKNLALADGLSHASFQKRLDDSKKELADKLADLDNYSRADIDASRARVAAHQAELVNWTSGLYTTDIAVKGLATDFKAVGASILADTADMAKLAADVVATTDALNKEIANPSSDPNALSKAMRAQSDAQFAQMTAQMNAPQPYGFYTAQSTSVTTNPNGSTNNPGNVGYDQSAQPQVPTGSQQDPLYAVVATAPSLLGAGDGSVGFGSGGVVTLGEFGPEKVKLPFGSQVFPNTGAGGGGGGVTVHNTFNVVDTEAGIVKRVGDTIMRQVTSGLQLPRFG